MLNYRLLIVKMRFLTIGSCSSELISKDACSSVQEIVCSDGGCGTHLKLDRGLEVMSEV